MNYLRFLDRSSDLGPALPGTYDLALVMLSFVVASVAADAAASDRPRLFFLPSLAPVVTHPHSHLTL